MAEVRIPFCATAEISPPFILDETFAEPNGVKSVLFDKSKLQVAGKEETVDVPNIGPVKMCIFYLVGTIPYICNAFPIIQSDPAFDVSEQAAIFNGGAPSAAVAATSASTPLGWVSAAGSLDVKAPVGGNTTLINVPSVVSVTVENLAVAGNVTPALNPAYTDVAAPEERKRVIKWRGTFVVTTS
jgi:hypothetical protein